MSIIVIAFWLAWLCDSIFMHTLLNSFVHPGIAHQSWGFIVVKGFKPFPPWTQTDWGAMPVCLRKAQGRALATGISCGWASSEDHVRNRNRQTFKPGRQSPPPESIATAKTCIIRPPARTSCAKLKVASLTQLHASYGSTKGTGDLYNLR